MGQTAIGLTLGYLTPKGYEELDLAVKSQDNSALEMALLVVA